eukprot:236720-Chlamydomonas_euryale.AAC.2
MRQFEQRPQLEVETAARGCSCSSRTFRLPPKPFHSEFPARVPLEPGRSALDKPRSGRAVQTLALCPVRRPRPSQQPRRGGNVGRLAIRAGHPPRHRDARRVGAGAAASGPWAAPLPPRRRVSAFCAANKGRRRCDLRPCSGPAACRGCSSQTVQHAADAAAGSAACSSRRGGGRGSELAAPARPAVDRHSSLSSPQLGNGGSAFRAGGRATGGAAAAAAAAGSGPRARVAHGLRVSVLLGPAARARELWNGAAALACLRACVLAVGPERGGCGGRTLRDGQP